MMNPDDIVRLLNLEPLPDEGGLFRQTYRGPDLPTHGLDGQRADFPRPISTAILYMLTNAPDSFSALHRLASDEVYHFYMGDPVEMILLEPTGASRLVTLGHDLSKGDHLQFVVPRGVWQGSRLAIGGRFALLGATMAPGYTQDAFELGIAQTLIQRYPSQAARIQSLVRSAANAT